MTGPLTVYRGARKRCGAAGQPVRARRRPRRRRLMLLLTGIAPPEIHLHTPGGITFCLPVEQTQPA